jgi:hypothetical protein
MKNFPIYSGQIEKWAESLVQVGDQNFTQVNAQKQQKKEVYIPKIVSVTDLPSPVLGGVVYVSSTDRLAKSNGLTWTFDDGTSVA